MWFVSRTRGRVAMMLRVMPTVIVRPPPIRPMIFVHRIPAIMTPTPATDITRPVWTAVRWRVASR